MISNYVFLPALTKFSDLALLIARIVTGVFLIHGVWDNIMSAERMAEFVGFMKANGFAWAEFWAPFSVYTQFLFGALLILGLFTRWAGIGIAITFITGLLMVHLNQSFREWWPALALLVIGLTFATTGAGRFSADAALERTS